MPYAHKPYSGICANCGETYIRYRPLRGTTCSPACSALLFRATPQRRICEKCGKSFHTKKASRRVWCENCSIPRKRIEFIPIAVSDVDRAYLAGVIDSDGCIGAAQLRKTRIKRGPGIIFCIYVSMADPQVPELLSRFYGGHVHVIRPSSRNKQRVCMYKWQGYGEIGARLLRDVLPYLRVKRQQADAYLRAMPTFTGGSRKGHAGPVPPSIEDVATRLACMREIQFHNQRFSRKGRFELATAPIEGTA